MQTHIFILASDDVDYSKLIGFVVFAVIWGISALAGVLKKVNAQAKAKGPVQRAPVAPQSRGPGQVAAPPARRKAAPSPKPFARQVPAMKRAAAPMRPVAVLAPLPPPIPAQRQPAPPPARAARDAPTGTAIGAPAARVVPSANATALRRWMRPMTMRQQFMLTELLQPPLTLRDSEI